MLRCSFPFFVVLLCIAGVSEATDGSSDPIYRDCLRQCEESGCVGDYCFSSCKIPDSMSGTMEGLTQIHLRWKQSRCEADCRYYCRDDRERERREQGFLPNKYDGKWHFKRVYLFQEPAPLFLAAMNFGMQVSVWLSFRALLYHKLPLRQKKRPYYEYATMWYIYGLLCVNFWFWSTVYHCRDTEIIARIKVSSMVALIGCSLVMAIIRSFTVKEEAVRVMIAAPLLAFSTTHVLFLNNYMLDHDWNHKVCTIMAAAELLIWATWALVTRHPSRWNLWIAVAGTGLAMFLETRDFPPYEGIIDGHSLVYATVLPVTYFWSRLVRDDAMLRTSSLVKKTK